MATNVVHEERAPGRVTDLVRWGPVVAGVVIALGCFALLNSLWLAVASGTGDGWVGGNLRWFIGGTAALALMLAGLLAGLLAGPRGRTAGLANGVTAWGLLFVLSLTALVPGAVNLTGQLGAGLEDAGTTIGGSLGDAAGGFTVASALWVSFWSLTAGLVLAAVGGLLGGAVRRSVVAAGHESRGHRPAVTLPPQATTTAEQPRVGGEPVRGTRDFDPR